MRVQLPTPKSGGLILSYRCSAECMHCMYACSPGWSADWILESDLEAMLAQLARTIEPAPYGPRTMSLSHGLHFTGGEPFLNFELLCTAVDTAHKAGIPSTFVETNCFWARKDADTRDKLETLKANGLCGIMISVNPFYLEYVPFERTERAIRISLEVLGHNVMVYQVEYFRLFKQMGIEGTMPFRDYLERIERKQDFARNAEFFLMGRSAYRVPEALPGVFDTMPARRLFSQRCSPPFLREWHNHFDNNGNYVPGYCGGISLGDARQLDTLLADGVDTSELPVLGLLMEEDLEGLYKFALDRGYREIPDGYCSRCHLCIDIRKHLASIGDYPELSPAEFYEHL